MKIFSDDPKPVKMRADRWNRVLKNALLAALSAFIISLAIPAGDLATATFGIMLVVFMVGFDLRDRALELFALLRGP
jgi:hypothetical protein